MQWNHLAKFDHEKKKSRANAPQSKVMGIYNNFNGDTDKEDWLVSKYSTSIRGENDIGLCSFE